MIPNARTRAQLRALVVADSGRDTSIGTPHAAGEVVGAVKRVAAAGEWRTTSRSAALGAPTFPLREACRLAVDAASAFGIDLCGVDLLPDGCGGWIVVELNGAVDLAAEYSLAAGNVFDEDSALACARDGHDDEGRTIARVARRVTR